MPEWYEIAYPGGPMVIPAAMFPTSLYPPDASAKGKTPSANGPDVEAIKRGLWRGGRWPGPASGFDRQFSNAISHGKSGGNVSDSGLAGFQRQMKIDPTGWFGPSSFNTLCSARIPQGLPNAGQPLLDVTAQNLFAEAFQMFGGSDTPPEPPKTKTAAQVRMEKALTYLGFKESPANSNNTIFGQWYGVNFQPWCAIFITYCDVLGGKPTNSFKRGSAYAYVPYIVSDAKNKRNGLSVPNSPQFGDLVCYDWGRDGTYDHVGLFEKWSGSSPSTFTAIEGNTSVGDDSNGGEVMRRNRDSRNQNTVFVRVAE